MQAVYELLFFLVNTTAMGTDKERKQPVTKQPVIFKPVYAVALVAWVCFVLWRFTL